MTSLRCPRLSPLRAKLAQLHVMRAAALLALFALPLLVAAGLAGFALLRAIALHWAGMQWSAFGFAVAGVVMCAIATVPARWLLSRVPEPDGIALDRREAASLYRRVERVARRTGAEGIDTIRITGDMNAAIVQRPRWGHLGPMHTCLQLGLPLVHSVSDRQLKAILAHECAHLALQRRGLGAWGHHLRSWAFRTMDNLVADVPFLPRWVLRRFDDLVIDAARLSRLEEYEADRAAARLVGCGVLAQTLVELSLRERFLTEDFMHRVMAQMHTRRSPAIRPYREMGVGMAAGFRWPGAPDGDLRVRSLGVHGEVAAGLHPPLSSRLWALRVRSIRARTCAQSAAQNHLSHLLPGLAKRLDQAWWGEVRRFWRTHYRRAHRQRTETGE